MLTALLQPAANAAKTEGLFSRGRPADPVKSTFFFLPFPPRGLHGARVMMARARAVKTIGISMMRNTAGALSSKRRMQGIARKKRETEAEERKRKQGERGGGDACTPREGGKGDEEAEGATDKSSHEEGKERRNTRKGQPKTSAAKQGSARRWRLIIDSERTNEERRSRKSKGAGGDG